MQWIDRNVEKPMTYIIVDNGDGTKTLIPSPGVVYEPGTPFTAQNLKKAGEDVANIIALGGLV